MEYKVEKVTQSSHKEVVDFLQLHENYSLFLLGNLEKYGARLSESPYSGNFKLIRSLDKKIVCVFCLTRRGSLLIQSTVYEPIFDIVLSACKEETMKILGVLGDWDICHRIWNFFQLSGVIQEETYFSKEVLYSVDVSQTSKVQEERVRLLDESDFMLWRPLRLAYNKEMRFPNISQEDQMFEEFRDKTRKKISWGLFIDEKLVSIADLNARAFDLGQVGGVYTDPNFRKRGLSKSVMRQLLSDVKTIHHLRKVIIFTDIGNISAQKVYESVHGKRIGYFGILFGR